MVGLISWQVERQVQEALRTATVPEGVPSGKLYVPKEVRSEVLQWGHASKLACHRGLPRTLHLLCQRFWWPSMARDACMECARGKSSHQAPTGLLQTLQVPWRPWSHIALDYVTGLPEFRGNTAVMTVVDHFSRAAHFIPLPKLPTAAEMGEFLIQ